MDVGKGIRHAGFPFLLLLSYLASCTLIREDRTRCPCLLTLRLERLPAHPVTLTLEGEGFREEYRVDRDTCLQVPVPKGSLRWTAVAGAQADELGCFRIPYGYDCPSLYLGGGAADTARDTAAVDVTLHKHFCTLQLEVVSPPGWGEPYRAEIRGAVAGIGPDGTPLEGDFACRLEAGFSARLPRQDPEAPLWLDIAMPDRVVRSFSLGTYLDKAGYDWSAPDLEDCPLELRLSVTRLLLQAGDWTEELPWDIDI